MAKKRQTKIADDDKSFEPISLTDLILHTLLDMFEFGAHSFDTVRGPYYWNSLGIDFESPFPKEEILAHANEQKAKKIYLAHTHPLSNDNSLTFLNAEIDPREEVAFDYAPLPVGNRPSSGDVSFLSQIQEEFSGVGIEIIGVVFSASGIWEYSIPDRTKFDAGKFSRAYDNFYPLRGGDFIEEWSARSDFPSYYMELQKPKMNTGSYTTQISKAKRTSVVHNTMNEDIAADIEFFEANGVNLAFHPYKELGIDPQSLMQQTLSRWTSQFAS